jgi:4'-phosphopantetheinyl transferase
MYPLLADDEIHVWYIDLHDKRAISSELFEFLSPEERARVDRFHLPRDKDEYVVCKGALRQILGMHLGVRPEEVQFACGSHGKPQLAWPCTGMALQFNVSHSQGLGLIAVARGMVVGADIERVRPFPVAESTARTHFSAKERGEISRLPDAKRHEGFFSCWTRKEAFVKAQGGGLSIPLNSFCVSARSGEAVESSDEGGDSKAILPWRVMDLRFEEAGADESYIGALVGPNLGWRASVRKWQLPRPL